MIQNLKDKTYTLEFSEVDYLINEILKDYLILYPFNPRKIAQERFHKLIGDMTTMGSC